MTNKIIEKLEVQIERLLDGLTTHETGSEDYKKHAEAINELCVTLNREEESMLNRGKLKVETMKVENDLGLRERQLDVEESKDTNALINNREQRDSQQVEGTADRDIQLSTLKDSKIWNAAKTGIEVVGVIAPLVFYGIWMNRGLQFEEEGSFTSQTFKGLIGKFKPNK